MKKRFYIDLAVLIILIAASAETLNAQYSIPQKMEWWYNARFGMFIHFGSYSYLAHGEWAFALENWTKANYQTQVSANFNPSSFNAGTIARLAKNAGMKYLVITAKHHEGFCMWQTSVQSFKDYTGTILYDLPDYTSFGSRDILKELKDSCDAVGVKFCLYYSILDWNHSSQTIFSQNYSTMASDSARESYISDMKAQLSELITKYHPAIMWFDGDWTFNAGSPTPNSWWTKNDGIDLYNYVISLDSSIIVNERVIRGFGVGDYENPEQQVPTSPRSRPWETCRTMNNSWGYASSDTNYKSPTALIQELVKVAARDGNYLLNIGPKGDGTIPIKSVSILNSFGDWMDIYGESIYATTRSPFSKEPHWGFYTRKDGKLFVHVFTWPFDGLLKIPSLANTVSKIYLMNDTTALLNFTDSLGCTSIQVPLNAPNPHNSVVVMDVSGLPTASSQYVKVSSIVVSGLDGLKSVSVGDTLRMSVKINPSDAAINSVTWSVSDTILASINTDGLVTGKLTGKVDVIATADDGTGIQGKLKVTVTNPTGVNDEQGQNIPDTPFLEQNYPNPFNPNTKIVYSIPKTSFVTIKVYDMLGKEITTLINEEKPAGTYEIEFIGSSISSGVYFYTLNSDDFTSTRKFILIK